MNILMKFILTYAVLNVKEFEDITVDFSCLNFSTQLCFVTKWYMCVPWCRVTDIVFSDFYLHLGCAKNYYL